ncbi:peptidoglycan editing factor PgeF [Martelella mediterranea]|uniref:Purine nucleoside phosphorylase n=1 Tax=Martelella mediterranea TaxID=293089 RepID=A0A4R3NSJ4_9HYPH|nr:peptidoglycan editing factor PgeF [Martelella mediterranea]TCT40198.1 hypothetical protein EDC90_101050 [Martelella mediterranea]
MLSNKHALKPVRSDLLTSACTDSPVRHGFFTRQGGVSRGIYESLNCGNGSDDIKAHIAENRRRVADWFGTKPEFLINLHQHHSADVITVDQPLTGERPKADALVTRTPGLVLGVLTADCGPVLFADAKNGVIGAAHAGWCGAFGGVLEATVEAMLKLGATRPTIKACLGPTISRHAYEVGPEFKERFCKTSPENDQFFKASETPDHAYFDLPAFIGTRLNEAGIEYEILDRCTYRNAADFFSFRRTTHCRESDYGRQISAIAM